MIIALAAMNNPTYSPQPWHGTLILWAFTIFAVMLNAFANPVLPKIEVALLVLHLLGWLVILVPLLAVSYQSTHLEILADKVLVGSS